MIEKISKININTKASFCLTVTFSLLKSTVLANFPFSVSKPVLKTYATQHSTGGVFKPSVEPEGKT